MLNKTYTYIALLFVLLFFGSANKLSAQSVSDSLHKSDVIIQVDGVIIYGKVIELNSDNIRYIKNDMPDGPIITMPRKLIYAVSYSNNTFQVVTPVFGKKNTNLTAYDQNTGMSTSVPDSSGNNFKYNLGHGSIKVAMGFSRQYSSLSSVDEYSKSASAPSLFAAYQIKFNRLIKVGASLGYAAFNYKYDYFSEYDQIQINQEINEMIFSLGLYARYDLMDAFIKPYLLGGVNFDYSDVTMKGEIYLIDDQKRVSTHSGIRGFKPNVVLRGGLDFNISNRFGLYSDIGTGTSLVQVGVIFILK
jgi:hypothetical protein